MATKRPLVNYAGQLSEVTSGDTLAPATLGTGTASLTTFLRGDNTWAAVNIQPMLTLYNNATSFNQAVLNPASFAADSTAFPNSVLAIALPPTFVTTSNTSFLLEVTGKDSTTGSFRVLIVGRVLGDGGASSSWTANSVLTLVGTPPFNSVRFGMSVAAPKTPMIVFGDGTTALNFPTYVVDRLTIIGPTANALYASGTPLALSVVAQASMAATFTVQNTVSPNVLASSYASLVSTTAQTFQGNLVAPNLTAGANLMLSPAGAPYSAGMTVENFGNGLILDFGSNYEQLTYPSSSGASSITSMYGSYFRLDNRDAQADQLFSVTGIPSGGGTGVSREQKLMKLDRSGNLFLTTNAYQVLTTNSPISAAKVGNPTAVSITASYAALAADTYIFASATSAAVVVTLPTAVGASGKAYTVKKTDSTANTVTVATSGGQTIDGGSTAVLSVQYTSLTLVSDGSNWMVV